MKLLGKPKLENFKQKYADSRKALDAWRNEVEKANWQTPQDIKNNYRTASFLENNQIIFNIKGNNYRLVVKINYEKQIVYIEWIGTHKEYNKKKF
jgi:mRNA interferase HigB